MDLISSSNNPPPPTPLQSSRSLSSTINERSEKNSVMSPSSEVTNKVTELPGVNFLIQLVHTSNDQTNVDLHEKKFTLMEEGKASRPRSVAEKIFNNEDETLKLLNDAKDVIGKLSDFALDNSEIMATEDLPLEDNEKEVEDLPTEPEQAISPEKLDDTQALNPTIQVKEETQEEAKSFNKDDPNLSTQEVLSHLLKNRPAGEGEFKIKSSLDRNDKGDYSLETFTLPSSPSKVFYKIGVTYTVGQEKFHRYIYTTATNPETAILAASNYKNTVIELAQAHTSGADYKGRLDKYSTLDDASRRQLFAQRSFKFSFVRDSAGRPIKLKDISSNNIQFGLIPKEDKEHVYVRQRSNAGKSHIKRVKKEENQTFDSKKVVYSSKEEAINSLGYDAGYEVKGSANIYKSFSGDNEEYIREIKYDIEKEAQNFQLAHKEFENSSLFAFLTGKDTKEFKNFLEQEENLKFVNTLLESKRDLSPEDEKHLSLIKANYKLNEEPSLEVLSAAIKESKKTNYQTNQLIINNLELMQRSNGNLINKYTTLLKLRQEVGEEIAKAPDAQTKKAAEDSNKNLERLENGFASIKQLNNLKKQIDSNQTFINSITARLDHFVENPKTDEVNTTQTTEQNEKFSVELEEQEANQQGDNATSTAPTNA